VAVLQRIGANQSDVLATETTNGNALPARVTADRHPIAKPLRTRVHGLAHSAASTVALLVLRGGVFSFPGAPSAHRRSIDLALIFTAEPM
jgi:hypothetical protein